MQNQTYTFCKEERLSSKKLITSLFSNGESLLAYPLKAVYISIPKKGKYQAQAAFSVSKKNFKKAVSRNLLKRRMREPYRLNKPEFYNMLGNTQIAVMFIYTGKEALPSKTIEKSMKILLNKIVKNTAS